MFTLQHQQESVAEPALVMSTSSLTHRTVVCGDDAASYSLSSIPSQTIEARGKRKKKSKERRRSCSSSSEWEAGCAQHASPSPMPDSGVKASHMPSQSPTKC